MKKMWIFSILSIFAVLCFSSSNAFSAEAEDFGGTIDVFKQSPATHPFFEEAYGYVVFPSIGKGGFVIGGAYGWGQVYKQGQVSGHAKLIKLSIGFQAGGQAFSEIIFFEDQRAYEEFTAGEFAFDATASAVAITVGAEAKAGTSGTTAGVSAGGSADKRAAAKYYRGMAVFVHALGGFMYEASVGGQKFSFDPLTD